MEFTFILYLFLAGAFGGFMAGLLGVGGGVVFVPLITHYIGTIAVPEASFSALVMANSFSVIFVIGIFGTLKQKKLGQFYPKIILATGIPAVIGSIGTSKLLVISGLYSKHVFSVFFIGLLCFVLFRFLVEAIKQKKNKSVETIYQPESLNVFLLPGFLSGIIAALSGLGGGIVMIPYFTQLLKMPIKSATAISLSVITLGALPLLVFYLFQDLQLPLGMPHTGHIIWPLVVPMILGSMLTVGFGVSLSKKISPWLVFILLSVFIIFTILKLLINL
jgi:uncharacterized protein